LAIARNIAGDRNGTRARFARLDSGRFGLLPRPRVVNGNAKAALRKLQRRRLPDARSSTSDKSNSYRVSHPSNLFGEQEAIFEQKLAKEAMEERGA
jgi:hypothetical protein